MATTNSAALSSQTVGDTDEQHGFAALPEREGGVSGMPRAGAASSFEQATPRLGRDRIGLVLTESVGVPVHAILAPGAPAPDAVLDLLLRVGNGEALVTFANPGTTLLARRSAAFYRDLHVFDLVLPDGIGMCLAVRLLHGLPAQRVSFDMTSLAPTVFEHARRFGLSVALVGGAPGVAARARDRLLAHFPGLLVTGAFDGYGDVAVTARDVVALAPRILICGMGGAAQEAFLLRARALGWRGLGFTCGGFLDQLQERVNYYPRWVDRTNLRWAYRLVSEPGRLWRRYLLDYSRFAATLCATMARR